MLEGMMFFLFWNVFKLTRLLMYSGNIIVENNKVNTGLGNVLRRLISCLRTASTFYR